MPTTPRQVTSPSPILQELIALGVVRMAADGKTPIVGAPPTTVPLVGYEQDPLTGGISLSANGEYSPLKPLTPINYRRPRTVHPAPPTITYSLTAPTTLRPTLPWKDAATLIGSTVAFNTGNGQLDLDTPGGLTGIEILFSGTAFTFAWKTQVSTAERVMVFVDGQPCMSAPATPSVSTSAGSPCYCTLTFGGAVKDARVEFLVTSAASFVSLYLGPTAFARAAPQKRRLMLVGDSFLGGSAAITSNADLPGSILALDYDINTVVSGLSGTGHATDNGGFKRFSDASRTAIAATFQPNQIIIMGSVNDDGKSGIQSSAELTIAAYKSASPNAKIIVYGPQPTNATATLTANRRANNQALKAAAESQGVTFRDMIGSAGTDTIPAFAAFTFYDPQYLVSALGSVWLHDDTASKQYPSNYGPGVGSQSSGWKLLTSGWYGTGQVGATASDGSRDTLVYSDGLHPTSAGCAVLAALMAVDI